MSNTFKPEAFDATKTHEMKNEIYVPLADRSTILTNKDDRHTTAANFLPQVVIDGAQNSRVSEGERHVWQPECTAPTHTSRPEESRANSPISKDGDTAESHLSRTPSGKLVWDSNNPEAQTPSPDSWESMTAKQKDVWNNFFDRETVGIKHVTMPYRNKEGGRGWHKDIQDGEWSWIGYVGQEPKLSAAKDN